MIEVTTKYSCDRCAYINKEGEEFFLIKKSLVDTKPKVQQATNFMLSCDGMYVNIYDQYTSYHLCTSCCKELTRFFKGDPI